MKISTNAPVERASLDTNRDAQVWAAAHSNQVPVVLSENFSHGAEIEGVRFVDPFLQDTP